MFDAIQINNKKILPVILMSICIFLSAMCKGIQGTFTAIGFLAYAFSIDKSFKKPAILNTIILALTLIALGTCLFLFTPAKEYFIGYYHTRIVNTFANPESATTDNRFYLLFRLLSEQILPILLCFIAILVSTKRKIKLNEIEKVENKKKSLLFLIIALAGTLPLLVTSEQRRFYLVPAFPFYAFALSFLTIEHLVKLFDKLNASKLELITKVLSMVLIGTTLVLTISNIGTAKRDENMLGDIYKIGKVVPENTSIAIDKELFTTWVLHLYFQRYYGISLDATGENKNQVYYLSKKNKSTLSNYSEIDLVWNEFKLCKKQK